MTTWSGVGVKITMEGGAGYPWGTSATGLENRGEHLGVGGCKLGGIGWGDVAI